jgi:parallel beta-helix repeat protein
MFRCATVVFVGLIALCWTMSGDPLEAQEGRRGGAGRLDRLGIIGDGKADESAAIQAAVDSGIGSLSFPKGIYKLTKTVVVDLDKVGFTSVTGDGTARFFMAGPGPAFRFVGTHKGSAAPKDFKPEVWDRQRAPQVVGIEIVGEHPEAVGIEADGVMQLTLSRIVVRKAKHAVHLVNRNRNVLIDACHLYENSGIGVFYDNVNLHQSNIVGCHISYNHGGGIVCKGGDVRNIHIGTCDIESNHGKDGPPTANVLIDSTGGTNGIAEVAITGCTIQHNSESPDSANIRIIGKSKTADREGYITITGNILSDVMTNVHLKDSRGVTLSANTFWSGYDQDLLLENCVGIVATGNAFDRNPRTTHGKSKDAKGGLILRDCADCIIQAAHINGAHGQPAGLLVENSARINISDCIITDCDNAGILLKETSTSRIDGCIIRDGREKDDDTTAISVSGGLSNRVTDNVIEGRMLIDPRSAKVD